MIPFSDPSTSTLLAATSSKFDMDGVIGGGQLGRMSLGERDVANLRNFFGRFAPEILATNYGDEIWTLYQAGALTPEVAKHAASSR